ncbi:MAG: alpha,alpha-trehalase [Paenibacillus sp.]|nr:alpha,alpha-trehalase [Paenibacillus sp.]
MTLSNIEKHNQLPRGMYFQKKSYEDGPLPTFQEVKNQLPQPIFEQRPDYLDCYWHTWEIAYRNLHIPTKESGFVSNFIDAAFNNDVFLWDTAFITMFCNLANPYIPGIRSLDNFYCKQFDDGEIPREMVRDTGKDFLPWVNYDRLPLHSYFHNHYGHRRLMQTERPSFEDMFKPELGRKVEVPPYLTLDNLNHPILAWAEWESFKHTGDVDRLEMIFEPNLRYYDALKVHLQNHFGLFVTDWASMDNNPRNKYLGSGVDISCEMVLLARNLIDIARVLIDRCEKKGEQGQAAVYAGHIARLEEESRAFTDTINRMMWNDETGFYYDVQTNGEQAPVKTIAAYWSLLAGLADSTQAGKLAAWLNDSATFNRTHRVPVLAADEPGYDPKGGYWRGSVWAPTNTMVIRGLEKYGFDELAREIALNHLNNVVQIYKDTGTIWENYPPDSIDSGNADKCDFVGWSGIAPILYLIEHAIGLKGDAVQNELTWKLEPGQGIIGCNRYWFAGKTMDLLATPQEDGTYRISATSDGPVRLKVQFGTREEVRELNDGIIELVV